MATLRSFTDLQEPMGNLGPMYQRAMIDAVRASGLPNYFNAHVIKGSDAPFTLARFHTYIYPYANPQHLAAQLDALVESGNAIKDGDVYALTDKGHQALETIYKTAHDALSAEHDLEMSDADLERLAELLRQVIDFVLTTDAVTAVTDKVSMTYSRWTHPENGGILAVIDQYMADLYAWRDDCHIQAWTPHMHEFGSGLGYEMFSFMWEDKFESVEAFIAATKWRGNDVAAGMAAQAHMVETGLLEKDGENYRISNRGRALRHSIEAETNRLYDLGFAALGEAVFAELDALFDQFSRATRRSAQKACLAVIGETSTKLFELFRDARAAVAEAEGYSGFQWTALYSAHIHNPINAAALQARSPYAQPLDFANAEFAKPAIEQGAIEKRDDGHYITESGLTTLKTIFQAVYDAFSTLEGLPDPQMESLYKNLLDVITAAKASRFATYALDTTSRIEPSPQSTTLAWIDQIFDELNAFRDDCHISTFVELDVDGRTWETLTFLWRDGLNTPEQVSERLSSRRRWTLEDYTASFETLVAKGWASKTADGYAITSEGQAVRDLAEKQTNDRYFAAWDAMGDRVMQSYRALVQIRDAVAKALEERTPVAN